MTRRILAIWLSVLLVVGAGLAVSLGRAQRARTRASVAAAAYQETRTRLDRLAASPAASATLADDSARTLAARVAGALSDAGLPPSTLADLSPERLEPITSGQGPTVARRRALLTLAPITLPQLGRFLESWRTAEPEWTVSALELAPQRQREQPPGGDLPLRVRLTLETRSIQESNR
jgi:hypothetical protein